VSGRVRTLAFALAVIVAALAAASLRAVRAGRAALASGDAAMASDRPAEAIADWEEAARWYVPFASHVDDAYARLAGLHANPDHAIAIAAARAERRAAWATRHVTEPHDPAVADRTIAALEAEDPNGALGAGNDRAARTAWQAARLARDPRPGLGASALAVAGIALWLAGAIGALVADRRRLVGLAIAVAGVAAWAAGLYNA